MTMTTTERPSSYAVGDLVTADPEFFGGATRGIVYKIVKVPAARNGVNYTAEPVAGGRGLRAPSYALIPHDADAPAVPVTVAPYVPVPETGSVVRVTGIPKINATDLYVVTGEARKPGCAKLVKMGGDGGRYWPAIPVARLTVIDPATITAP